MRKVSEKNGAKIHLNTNIKKVLTKNKKAIGVEFMDGEKKIYDSVIINADF
jgi:phytoene desaturase